MPGNSIPIYSKVGKINWNAANITAANTAKDGTGTVDTVFTADATNGSFVQKIVVRPKGTNVATVMRVFLNNGSTNATAANNSLLGEIGLPATTLSEVAAIAGQEVPINFALPPGYKLNVVIGTAVAAGFAVNVIAGDY